jgi:hypothetical protein
MAEELWLPTSIMTFATPETLPGGSLVFVPPHGKAAPSPALRFDQKDDDGKIWQWLLWLQGAPWGADKTQRTATRCRDFHANDEAVPAIVPGPSVRLDVEIDMRTDAIEDLSWYHANGVIACSEFGVRVAAREHSDHRSNSVPIDPITWLYDPEAQRQRVSRWYPRWRVRVWNGVNQTYSIIQFKLPDVPD